MKICYKSKLEYFELDQDQEYLVYPYASKILLELSGLEMEEAKIYVNKELWPNEIKEIEIRDKKTSLEIVSSSGVSKYLVTPIIQPLNKNHMIEYLKFGENYQSYKKSCVSSSLKDWKTGLKLYATDESTSFRDIISFLKELEDDYYKYLRYVSIKPISHLKVKNEVRPIDTVKRIGYESIPYLASHSEDWQTRTISGLKPSRLFARTEDDDFQIYENKVVKTLIDNLITFLQMQYYKLNEASSQLRIIMNAGVETNTASYDKQHYLSISKILSESIDEITKKTDERRVKREKADRMIKHIECIIKKLQNLKKLKLYRMTKSSKPVGTSIKHTNILLMDRYYKHIFKLWKEFNAAKASESDSNIEYNYKTLKNEYLDFCVTITQFAALSLEFEFNGLNFKRSSEVGSEIIRINIIDQEEKELAIGEITLCSETKKMIELSDKFQKYFLNSENNSNISIKDNYILIEGKLSDKEIEAFCLPIKRESSLNKNNQQDYRELKQIILKSNNLTYMRKTKIIFVTTNFLLPENPISKEKECFFNFIQKTKETHKGDFVVVFVPQRRKNEENLIQYGRMMREKGIAIIPVTLFDINSYRRVQNILLQKLTEINDGKSCPNCGGLYVKGESKCEFCTLVKTTTTCSKCKHEFAYLKYNIKENALSELKEQNDKNDFMTKDSLFQYKNIVEMSIEKDKIVPICPKCGER